MEFYHKHFICILYFNTRNAEKLYAQTSWGDRRQHNKDLLSRNGMLVLRAGSATGHQSGCDLGSK
jgi:hypothetical protein